MNTDFLIGISLVVFGTLLGAIGAFLLKIGGSKIQSRNDLFNIQKVYLLLLGVCLYGFSAIVFTFALQFGELSMLYPFVSLSYIWATFLSISFLHEKVNHYRWTGIFFIILGVVVMAFAG